jgi:hydroxypyruvate isomerase
MIFTEFPFIERFAKAKEAGFDYVEFWCWEDKDIDAIRKALDKSGIKIAVFQGNTVGRMVDINDKEKYVQGVKRSVETAKKLGAERLFLMSDILKEDRSVLEADRPISEDEKRQSTIAILRELIPVAEESGITFVIEPLNTLVDHKGYSLRSSEAGASIIREIGHKHIRLLYDAYHMQIMEGNIIANIRDKYDTFGHFHIADVPGRFEPGTGEMNYRNILKALMDTGYDGIVGFEFEPKNGGSAETCKRVFEQIR